MKTIKFNLIFLVLTLCTIAPFMAEATIWRVNKSDATADFDDTHTAHNSPLVLSGDTLHVEGATDSYTNFTCTKRLVIIGPGYFLNINQKSANLVPATISSITFNAGSEGSVVTGMVFGNLTSSGPTINVDNISIERCYIGQVWLAHGVEGIRIIGNYLRTVAKLTSSIIGEVHFNHNIVTQNINLNANSTFTSCNNNIFEGSSYTFHAYHFRNNIVISGSATLNITTAHMQNNIGTNGVFNFAGGSNINVNDINSLFVGGESPDAKYILSGSSAAKGAGFGGVDCGIFGTDTPYLLSGIPPVPAITRLEVENAAGVDTGLKIKMTVTAY